MLFSASDFYAYYRPWPCELRVYLRARGVEEEPPSPYLEVVRQLGLRHEAEHLSQLGEALDLSGGSRPERERRTIEAIRSRAPVIYHPRLRASTRIGGVDHEIVGEPDYLLHDETGYAVRDSKVARHITEDRHPEILRGTEIYGWLFEKVTGVAPLRLEVHAGTGEIVELPYDGGTKALEMVAEIARWSSLEAEPYQPLSWSGCGPCPFQTRCWAAAEARKDASLVVDVDKSLARALHEQGISNWDELLARFDSATLSEFRRPWGSRMQRVGKKAERILLSARALAENRAMWLAAPTIPPGPDWVMFDLEGFPPQLHDDEKVFLWGMQVFGAHPSEYMAALPDVGGDGDRVGWDRFLAAAEALLDRYGDIPFVHWHHYERDRLNKYIARFGDLRGIAARVQRNLFDLLPAVESCVALPLPSYSLKVVEGYVGYKRTLEGANGDWAMASYFHAAESQDRAEAERLIDDVCRYNREDLEATWAVLRWVRAQAL